MIILIICRKLIIILYKINVSSITCLPADLISFIKINNSAFTIYYNHNANFPQSFFHFFLLWLEVEELSIVI